MSLQGSTCYAAITGIEPTQAAPASIGVPASDAVVLVAPESRTFRAQWVHHRPGQAAPTW